MLKKFGLDSKRVINDSATFIMLGCAVLALGINVFLAHEQNFGGRNIIDRNGLVSFIRDKNVAYKFIL